MIELQCLNRILKDGNFNLLKNNGLNENDFNKFSEEYDFIEAHYRQYNSMPDRQTIINKFPQFEFFNVEESDKFLVDTLIEQSNFYKLVEVMREAGELLKTDSNLALDLVKEKLPEFNIRQRIGGTNIIQDLSRFDSILEKQNNQGAIIKTGLKELDEIIYGFMPGEELVTIVARTGMGKTWLALLFLQNAWEQGNRVGLYSGEMTGNKIGYRVDTLMKNFSNRDLVRGTVNVDDYQNYLMNLKQSNNPFYVLTPNDLGGRATVTNLEDFIDANNLDILAVDQITLMRDGRAGRGSSTREQLEHISGDLFDLSIKKRIPIILLSQANRTGARKDEDGGGTPDIENIYGADAIAQNSTKVITIRQTGAGLELQVKKNRDDGCGDPLLYYWDINTGIFKYLPNKNVDKPTIVEKLQEKYQDSKDVF